MRITLNKPHLVPQPMLCRRCAAINPDCFSSEANGRLANELRTHDALYPFEDSCPLCQLLCTIIPSFDHGFHVDLQFVNRGDSHWLPNDTLLFKASYGPLTKSYQYLVPQVGKECTVRVLQPDLVNFEVVQEWIEFCMTKHHEECGLERPRRVPYLKLIDCETRRIVPAEDFSYICLSYVWGQTLDDNTHLSVLPCGLPTTIEDAITVTLKLGMRYLWVDRYCIDQQNKVEVLHQLKVMDLIYQNAELTIVAAAGEDPWYGLPGVSSRPRDSQLFRKIWGILFVPPVSSPVEFIEDSTWNTRGWTYQEALFSRRRLVFTNQQAYFECNRMGCAESLNISLKDLHNKTSQRFLAPHGFGHGAFPHTIDNVPSPSKVYDCIFYYSMRKLTKSSDILNGILATLSACERKYGIYHCWGVPSLLFLSKTASQRRVFIDGLCWTNGNLHVRRPGFPSWSWAGWYGHVSWGAYYYRIDPSEVFKLSDGIELRVELCDGQVMLWEKAQPILQEPESPATLSTFVHITAWTIIIRTIKKNSFWTETFTRVKYTEGNEKSSQFQALALQNNGEYYELGSYNSSSEIQWTGSFKELPEFCIGIHLGSWKTGEDRSEPDIDWKPRKCVILIVGEVSEGKMERIGIMRNFLRQDFLKWSLRSVQLG